MVDLVIPQLEVVKLFLQAFFHLTELGVICAERQQPLLSFQVLLPRVLALIFEEVHRCHQLVSHYLVGSD